MAEETNYTLTVTPKSSKTSVYPPGHEEDEFVKTETPIEENSSKQTLKAEGKLVPLSKLFTYADSTDYLLMFLGTLGGVIGGLGQPAQILFLGDVVNSFNPSEPVSPETMKSNINSIALNFVLLGVAVLIGGFFQVAMWNMAASRQAKKIRAAYVSSILTKEIGWFDVNEPMEMASRVAESTVAIQEGMGRKVGDGIFFLSMGVGGIFFGLYKGWELALVLLALSPLVATTGYISMKVISNATQSGIESYGKAGAVAQESVSNIRTVHMFNSVAHFIEKYAKELEYATHVGIKKHFAVGWGTGLVFFTMFCTYAVGMYYGAYKIANDWLDGNTCEGNGCYDGGRVLIVFFGIIMGAMALGQAGPSVEAIVTARAAAYDVFSIIERPSLIDPVSESGIKLPKVIGDISIENVTFAYPSRPEVQICSDYSLNIKAGETIALVGPSGSGKSTIVSLLERFYDPQAGSVKLDGHDIKELNVMWLRQQVGLVGQEPALFATTIMENIRYGAPQATDDEVLEAAKSANAYNFIMEFPNGFMTEVGERGTQLSGGQKQRIAIARAIIKNPPILLLDEATSALDTESEHVVQQSLDKLLAATKRTTIIVAHRLSTIRNANRIAVHSGGKIVELGSHDELMAISNGRYRTLVETQNRLHDTAEVEFSDDPPVSTELSREQSGISLTERSLSRNSVSRQSDSALSNKVRKNSTASDDEELVQVPISRLWKLAAPEWKFMFFGSIGAIVNAAIFPLWGVIFTKVVVLFFEYHKTKSQMLSDAMQYSLIFLGLGVAFGCAVTLQHYAFGVASQKLVTRVRLATYSAMLRQEVGWFDRDSNTSGALVSRLATDAATLQAMTSDTLNSTLVNLTTLGVGFAIAFYYSWQMTLALLATSPVLGFSSYVQAQQMTGTINNQENNDADDGAGSLLAEAIGSIRTVASFSMEKALNMAYVNFLSASNAANRKVGIISGATFGLSQGVMFFNLGFLFWLGGKWVANGTITFEDMFMVLMVIMLSMFAVGMATQGLGDQAKAKKAASRVFQIIDRVPEIDATSVAGEKLPTIKGDLELRNLHFAYPSRPNAKIYDNYSLKIKHGQTVALVGASGSGKSTAISLIERFYDPSSGTVLMDGHDIRKLNVQWLRERISLVSQEPVLFSGTIGENIALGKPGSTIEEVMDAAKKANAYNFITSFPNGFDTEVGDRGAQVSGGQKQRIAIARAILRDPEVLLLDEATSALDSESERVVQESLDALLASKNRTTVIVAHRLSTIRNADLIAVTHEGAIVEKGTHDELMKRENGVYKALVARQVGN